jgi:hypothetical protein
LQGVRKRCRNLAAKVNVFVEKIIDEHKMKRVESGKNEDIIKSDESSGDFVDVLLDLQKENKLSAQT